ncbi:hypothetical protein H257_13031 [Aphanomyces astaci]|uniref:Ubiquitin-like protease family profile domain-containing protein n=1 Tax=Aphanomyces astaci TaxID=112090 RepID=W4FY49_APHAT|nr:hypothetical protein H257_13031 [Aphanomyces astaci]ETV71901.1 hypothetical protein H257_13031 [Aphanomyces astaci]|eukprot:XP_009838750.1 hypothetical protein H257_13031 [Aphanomyces astaci]
MDDQELGIDIVQTELSISAQQYLVKHYCSSATSPPHTLAYKDIPSCSSSTLSKKQPTSTRQSTRVPKQPIKHVAAPVVVLDDSDASEAEIVPRPPSRLELTSEGFELDKVVSTPFGIGLIVALPTTTTTSSTTTSSLPIKRSMNKATVPSNYSYKVQLSYGDGYFHATSLTLVDDKVQYTYYKKRSKGWVVLTYGDTSRLCGHRLLNDSVIEFYLSYLMDTLPTPAVERTYMCSSFLFGQYLVTKKQALRKVALSNVEQAYASVARWTKSIDVFNTKYLVVPVNEEGHWSVAIVCNLYRFANTSVCRCAVVDPHGRAAHPSSPSALKPAKRPAPAARTLLPKRLKAPPLTQRGVKVVVMESVPSNEFDDVANGPVSVPPPSSWQTQGGESGGSCALTKGQATPSGGSTLNPTLCENEPAGVVTSDERPVSVQFKRPSEPCAKSEQQQHQSGASKSPQEPVGPQRCNTCGLVQDIDQDTNHRPCIVFLDSLKAHRTLRIAKFLREYLQMEWRARKAPTCGPMSITVANLPMISPREIPRQSNYTDCGVFVLHYVEKFLSNPPLMSTALIATKGGESQGIMTKNWFHPRVIQLKRVAIRHLIETLAKQSHYTAQPTRQVSPTHHEES